MGLKAELVESSKIGWFRIYATPPGGRKIEITTFRGAPVNISSMGTSDPFGETTCALEFVQITPFDRPGQGDLSWLTPYSLIDIVWYNLPGYNYVWSWEGFIIDESVSVSDTSTTYTVECKGALYQLDNYLAKPNYPQQPIPYEHLIDRAFDPDLHPGSAVQGLRIIWPSDWNVIAKAQTDNDKLWFLRPFGVTPGQKWSGLATRATGAWEPTVSSFVQGLLAMMYDEAGAQWTIRNDRGRIPVLYLRHQAQITDPNLLTITAGTPGVSLQFSRDFTQAANVIYGIGKDIAGTTFSGMQVSDDGTETYYEPMAYSPAVYPDERNPAYNENLVRRETQIQFPDGMDEISAQEVARAQYYRFADPGFTGQITLTTDPVRNDGTRFPRMLIKAGASLLVNGFRGGDLLCHITTAEIDMDAATATLTVDTKYRDALTVNEVRARTRDALTPIRLLKPGSFSTILQENLVPWSYDEGSGFLPRKSRELFLRTAKDDAFPWENLTKKYPPKDFPEYYLRVRNPDRLTTPWKSWYRKSKEAPAEPIRMAQSGTIRLSQIAAYDENGNVIPVRFHIAVYANRGVHWEDMPRMPNAAHKHLKPPGSSYGGGARTPFFKGAFEEIEPSGAKTSEMGMIFHQSAEFQMGWGNYFEPAGYSPGLASRGASRTGMLHDETPWNFDTTSGRDFDPQKPKQKAWSRGTGMAYVMIFCDDRPVDQTPGGYNGPVYFLGRFFRQEPGA